MSRSSKKAGEVILEIGTEEIPSWSLPTTLRELEANAGRMLSEGRLSAREVRSFGTPRRLVLWASGIPARQETRVTEVIGPPRSAWPSQNFRTGADVPPRASRMPRP